MSTPQYITISPAIGQRLTLQGWTIIDTTRCAVRLVSPPMTYDAAEDEINAATRVELEAR